MISLLTKYPLIELGINEAYRAGFFDFLLVVGCFLFYFVTNGLVD